MIDYCRPSGRQSISRTTIAFAVAAAVAGACVEAHEPERIVAQASDLVPWCQAEAQARYVARDIPTYQWTASYHEDANMLVVEGKLHVHGDDVSVVCRIARGARESYGTIAIDDPRLQ